MQIFELFSHQKSYVFPSRKDQRNNAVAEVVAWQGKGQENIGFVLRFSNSYQQSAQTDRQGQAGAWARGSLSPFLLLLTLRTSAQQVTPFYCFNFIILKVLRVLVAHREKKKHALMAEQQVLHFTRAQLKIHVVLDGHRKV